MTVPFTVERTLHRALGPLVRLTIADDTDLAFTAEEAATVSRALRAVRDGRSAEREIFLSPIASDRDFQAVVGTDGIEVAAGRHTLALAWEDVERLAAALAEAADAARPAR